MEDYARIDSNLAESSLAIGVSSNLAQIGQTYMYNFKDEKYKNYVCILSVLAQVAIDNAKRKFDIDLNKEIDNIKKDMDIKNNGYPEFWKIIKRDFKGKNINTKLKCPMNELYNIKIERIKNEEKELPMEYFFIKHKLDINRRKAIKVENFIEEYCFDLKKYNSKSNTNDESDTYKVLVSDFDDLIKRLSTINISSTYISLFSWLVDRCFGITNYISYKKEKNLINSITNKNKSLLMSTLYNINKDNLLKTFKKSV